MLSFCDVLLCPEFDVLFPRCFQAKEVNQVHSLADGNNHLMNMNFICHVGDAVDILTSVEAEHINNLNA